MKKILIVLAIALVVLMIMTGCTPEQEESAKATIAKIETAADGINAIAPPGPWTIPLKAIGWLAAIATGIIAKRQANRATDQTTRKLKEREAKDKTMEAIREFGDLIDIMREDDRYSDVTNEFLKALDAKKRTLEEWTKSSIGVLDSVRKGLEKFDYTEGDPAERNKTIYNTIWGRY